MPRTTKSLPRPDFELAKQLPGASQLERVRAARGMLATQRFGTERHGLAAFIAIFHPEKDIDACLRRAGEPE